LTLAVGYSLKHGDSVNGAGKEQYPKYVGFLEGTKILEA